MKLYGETKEQVREEHGSLWACETPRTGERISSPRRSPVRCAAAPLPPVTRVRSPQDFKQRVVVCCQEQTGGTGHAATSVSTSNVMSALEPTSFRLKARDSEDVYSLSNSPTPYLLTPLSGV